MPRQLDSVSVAQDRPSQGPRVQPSPPQPPQQPRPRQQQRLPLCARRLLAQPSRQHPAQARSRGQALRQGQARRAMRARMERPRPRKGCRRADRHLRRPRQPPGPPDPQALARNAPRRTTGNQARRPRARDGTRRSPGPRPDRGTRPEAPLHIRCRTALAASIGHRSGIAHRHVRQASARIVPRNVNSAPPGGRYSQPSCGG